MKNHGLLTFDEVADKVEKFLPGYTVPLKILLAVAISSQFNNFPAMLWILFVDVPSSGKTDLVRLIKGTDFSYNLDNITPNAFVSGERVTLQNKVHDLLPLLNGKCFVVKDWTSLFSMDEKTTRKIIGDLVNIYDKEFSKFSPARGSIHYESSFSHLGCITPATLNKHTNYLNMIGARFLFYNMPLTSQVNESKSLEEIFSGKNRNEVELETREVVSSYLNQLAGVEWDIQPLTKAAQSYLTIGSKLVAHCRGIAIIKVTKSISDTKQEITEYELLDHQIEMPWRALNQLITLAKCLAFVVREKNVGINELEIIKDIILASMPADRSKALRSVQQNGGMITAKELTTNSDLGYRTGLRILEELVYLKVMIKIQGSGSMSTVYKLRPEFQNFICLSVSDFMSAYSSMTETPRW